MNRISKILLLVVLAVCIIIPSTSEARGRKKCNPCNATAITTVAPDCYHGCIIPCGTCTNVMHYHRVLIEEKCVPEIKHIPVTTCQPAKCCMPVKRCCNAHPVCCKPAPCNCCKCKPVVIYQPVTCCKPVVTCRPIVVYQATVQPVVTCCQPVVTCCQPVVSCCPRRFVCPPPAPAQVVVPPCNMPCGKKGDSN